MPNIFSAQSNFAQGELSPLLAGRSDIGIYKNGAARLLNRRPLSQGGTDTRPGLRYVGALPAGCILVPFIFSQSQRFVVALSGGRVDIWNAVDGSYSGALTGCPWTASMVAMLNTAQSYDTMLIFHPLMPPQRLLRTSGTTFGIGPMPIEAPPFSKLAASASTLDMSAVGADGTGGNGTFNLPAITSAWVGRQVRWQGKRARITAVSDTTHFNYQWIDPSSGLTLGPTPDWQEEAWSPSAGYPRAGCFQDGRLWLGGSAAEPATLWASRPGAYYNWNPGEAADGDAIADTISDGAVGDIRHLVPSERLLIFTSMGVWYIPGSESKPVTPSTIAFRRVGEMGAGVGHPHRADGAVLYADSVGRTVHQVVWSDTMQSYEISAASVLAEHLIRNPVSATALYGTTTRPERLSVFANSDGGLAVLHLIRAESITAWCEWRTAGLFRQVCAVERDLYAAVERNGVWTLEWFQDQIEPVDCSLTATADAPTRIFPGFQHLAGKVVTVVTRGHDLGDVTVGTDGTITLPDSFPQTTLLEAGHRFEQIIRPMPAAFDLQDGAARTKLKRLKEVQVQVHKSGMLRVNGRTILLDFQGDDVTTPAAPFTGILKARTFGLSMEAQFDLIVAGALKATVLGITRVMQINGS